MTKGSLTALDTIWELARARQTVKKVSISAARKAAARATVSSVPINKVLD